MKQSMEFVIIDFFILVIIPLATATSCGPSTSILSNSWIENKTADSSEVGFRFYPYSFRSPPGYDVHQCALYCEQDPRCKSFNFLNVEKMCELNNEDRRSVQVPEYVQVGQAWLESVNGLVPYEGSQYFARNVFTLKSKDSLDGCSSSPCPINHVCSSGESGSYQCQRTEFTADDFLKQWAPWGQWTDCSVSCGTGVQERKRECEIPEDFWLCEGRSSERRLCNEVKCPMWSYWGGWSDCQLNDGCGFGTRNRSRICNDGVLPNQESCPGSDVSEAVCREASCDTPVMLGSGTYGDVYIYDDTMLYEPVWRQVCEPQTSKSALTVKVAVCAALGLDLADDDVMPSVVPNDDDLVFEPEVCGLETRRLMRCVHNGWTKAKDCQKMLAVKCADSPEKGEAIQCSPTDGVTIACSEGKEIRVDEAFHGREKSVTTCSSPALKSNCFVPSALEVFEKACQFQTQCALPFTHSLFTANPCTSPDTSYSKMKYSCIRYLLPFYSGLKNGRISDDQISSSSNHGGYRAHHARLDRTVFPECWAAGRNRLGEWLQVQFSNSVHLLGAITQSRYIQNGQWVKYYKVTYGNSTSDLKTIKDKEGADQIFLGHTESSTTAYKANLFETPVYASIARLVVQEWHGHITMRMEWLIAD